MENQYLILGLSLSIMFNVLVLLVLIGTGMGKDVWQRFWWKLKHRSGKYAYSLMATKSGIIKEVFAHVEDGKFDWDGSPYVREPRITRNYRGIPANFHLEGSPNPIDPWSLSVGDWAMSTGELDDVIMANQEFDVQAALKRYAMVALIALGVVVIGVLVNLFFGYSAFELLRDGGEVAAQVVAS